ncbi:MAG TPA: DUF3857 domain-containing protein [Terriglobales bacterium]|nr:DUF3857 domain-containing protein [Terriglobales bacterium]
MLISVSQVSASQVAAAPPHFSEDAKALYAAASEPVAPDGTAASVLRDEESYIFDADGRNIHTIYVVFKVLTQSGAENWDAVAADWEPWHEQRPTIRARVITPDFTVHQLDEKTITDAPEKENESSVYSDQRVMRAPLPAIASGSVVEEEIISQESAPFFGAGTVGRFFFGRVSVPVHYSRLLLEAPTSVTLRYAVQSFPEVKTQRTEANGKVTIVLEHGPMQGLENGEFDLPSDFSGFPVVTFSTGTSWKQVAQEYAKVVDKQSSGADVKVQVEKLVKGRISRDEKAQAILQYMGEEIRYTGVEFGESAIVPHAPGETLSHKYGDCKDKSVLLVAMLRAAGIPAYVALLNAGRRLDVPADLPGMGLFDHAIVYMPGTPDLWIDATDQYARLGQLPTADQGRLALVARDESDGLIRTSESASVDNVLFETREFLLAENGPARVVETSRPRGSFESEFRSIYADKQDKRNHDNLSGYVKAQYLAEKLDRIDRTEPNDFSHPFELVLESQKAKRGATDLDSAVAAIRLEGLFYRMPDELQRREKEKDEDDDSSKRKTKRTADYQLQQAFVTEWQYKIVPPAGFRAKPLPQDMKISLGPATLTAQFSKTEQGVVNADIRFDTVKRRFTIAEATEMRNKIAELRQGEAIMVNFEPEAEALLREGKIRESFQSYRKLAAQHPKEAIHHLQLASALLHAGLGEAARQEAQLAVKLEPKSAVAQKTLAEILEHDLVGRKFRSGSDFAGAAAAYREAIKLDPDDTATVGNLGLLLEYNDEGMRYGKGAKLKESIEVFRTLTAEKLAGIGLQNNVAFDLFYAGEFEEARKSAETLNPQPKALIVACESALRGSQSGITEASKRSTGDAEYKQTVLTAGQMLMNLRQYAGAADLMQAGASGDTAARMMGLAALLRKTKKREDIQLPDTPEGAAKKFLVRSMEGALSNEAFVATMSKNAILAWNANDPQEKKRIFDAMQAVRRGITRSGASVEVTLDIVLESTEATSDGSDAVGYREKFHVIGGKVVTFYLVKENGKYLLLDSSEQPDSIGFEILDHVAANDLAGAKMMLDWIREDRHLAGGDDPLSGEPFPRFWTVGKDADLRQAKLAAAALLVQHMSTAKRGIEILEEARKTATADPEKTNINLALVTGYENVLDYANGLTVSSELSKQYPESKLAFTSQALMLAALGRFGEADQLAEARLKRIPDDIDAFRAMARTADVKGDPKASYEIDQRIVAAGKAEAYDLNGLAWQTLFFARPEGPDTESAVKASQMSQNSPSILHTLACLYAESGKVKEAHEVLLQAMDLMNLAEPNSDYWYAFGRVAEQYGESQVAKGLYGKVSKPKNAIMIPDSSYQLAQNRLSVLGTEPSSAKRR